VRRQHRAPGLGGEVRGEKMGLIIAVVVRIVVAGVCRIRVVIGSTGRIAGRDALNYGGPVILIDGMVGGGIDGLGIRIVAVGQIVVNAASGMVRK